MKSLHLWKKINNNNNNKKQKTQQTPQKTKTYLALFKKKKLLIFIEWLSYIYFLLYSLLRKVYLNNMWIFMDIFAQNQAHMEKKFSVFISTSMNDCI